MKQSVLNNLWEVKEAPEKESLHLSQVKDINITIANLLTTRGISVDNYDNFIDPCLKNQMPDPFTLKDCEKACKIIADSIENSEKITIYGDYDVDGGTATATFVKFLRHIRANVNFYIPNKLEEGYGPNEKAFTKLAEEGTDLLITVDCGISAFAPMESAKFKTIIIDHHMAEERLPKAEAVVNPKRLDDTSELDGLAGVAIAFLVCVAINRELEDRGFFKDSHKPNLMSLLDLVALGTVCDVMKLTDLNRAFVSQGLKVLNKKSNMGVKALSELLEIKKPIETYHLGYVFGPRLNAGGRLGRSKLATELLVSEDYDKAMEIAEELNQLNEHRKDIESKIHDEALAELEAYIQDEQLTKNHSFVYKSDWHSGVLGIVASRLKERFNKPALVLCFEGDVAHGSGRSVKGVDLGAIVVLGKQKGILRDGGGHKMAAGFSCDVDKLGEVEEFFTTEIDKQTEGQEILNTIYIDAVTSVQGANLEFIDSLKLMAPFGNGNAKPKFCINDLSIAKTIVIQGKHIKCFLRSPFTKGSIEAIIFNAIDTKIGDFLLNTKENISIVGSLDKNTWNGRDSVQLLIEDVK